jgi:two-component system sensor histidine kinase KdpD
LYVVHVQSRKDEDPERRRTLEASLQFAANLGAQIVHLSGKNIPSTTAAFVSENRITQAIFGRSALHGLRKWLYYLAIQRFMSEAPHVDLHIVTQENR